MKRMPSRCSWAAAGAQILDDFKISGNRLGLPWDGDCGGDGPAFGCWNVHVDGGGNKWESLWACLASFKEDLDRCSASWAQN